MSLLRRISLILLGLLLVVIVTLVLLVPDLLVRIGTSLAQISPIIRTALVIVANVLILAVLYLQIRPTPRANSNGLIVKASGVLADVSPESAQQRIVKAVRSVQNVVSADAKLETISGKADIEMDVGVVGDNVNVPQKQKEIDRALRQVVLKQLGLQLASRPRIHIQLLTEEEIAPPPRVTPPSPPPVQRPVEPVAERPFSDEPRRVRVAPMEETILRREEPVPPPVLPPAKPEVVEAPPRVEPTVPPVDTGALPPDDVDSEKPEATFIEPVIDSDTDRLPPTATEESTSELPSSDTASAGLYDEDDERRKDETLPPSV